MEYLYDSYCHFYPEKDGRFFAAVISGWMCNLDCAQGGVVTFYPEEEDGRLQWMRVEHV